jgi:tetratricopeptide (TPR) repeat protein
MKAGLDSTSNDVDLPLNVDNKIAKELKLKKSIVVTGYKFAGKTRCKDRLEAQGLLEGYEVTDVSSDSTPAEEAYEKVIDTVSKSNRMPIAVFLTQHHVKLFEKRFKKEKDKSLFNSFAHSKETVRFTEDEALELFKKLTEDLSQKVVNKTLVKKIIAASRRGDGEEETYVPALISASANRLKEKIGVSGSARASDPNLFSRYLEEEEALIDAKVERNGYILSALGLSTASLSAALPATEMVLTALDSLKNFVNQAIPLEYILAFGNILRTAVFGASTAGLGVLGIAVVKGLWDRHKHGKKKNILGSIASAKEHWNSKELTDDERKLIGYDFEQKNYLSPGTGFDFLNTLFSGTKIQELELQVDTYFDKHSEEIWGKFRSSNASKQLSDEILSSLSDRFQKELDDHFKAITNAQEDLAKVRTDITGILSRLTSVEQAVGIYSRPESLGISFRDGQWTITADLIGDSNIILVRGKEFDDYASRIFSALTLRAIVVVTGPQGIGKSILGRFVLSQKLLSGDANVVLDEEKLSGQLMSQVTSRDTSKAILFYDASPPELYEPSEVSGVQPPWVEKMSQLSAVVEARVNEVISVSDRTKTPALIVIPEDPYWRSFANKDWVESVNKKREITEYLFNVDLRNENFLSEVIMTYARSSSGEGDASVAKSLANKIMDYHDGYTLVSAYAGRWMNLHPQDPHVIEAIAEAKGNATVFLGYFVRYSLLENELGNFRSFGISLKAHYDLGDMTAILAERLPIGLGELALKPQVAEWISRYHEHLVEQMLFEMARTASEPTSGDTSTLSDNPKIAEMMGAFKDSVRNISKRGYTYMDTSMVRGTILLFHRDSILTYAIHFVRENTKVISQECEEYLLRLYASSLTQSDYHSWVEGRADNVNEKSCGLDILSTGGLPSASRRILLGSHTPTTTNGLIWELGIKSGDTYASKLLHKWNELRAPESTSELLRAMFDLLTFSLGVLVARNRDGMDKAVRTFASSMSFFKGTTNEFWFHLGIPLLKVVTSIIDEFMDGIWVFNGATDDFSRLLWEGLKHMNAGDVDMALQTLMKAREVKPQSPGIRNTIAYVYLQKKNLEEAEEMLNEAIELDREGHISYLMMMGIEMNRGDRAKVGEWYRRALSSSSYSLIVGTANFIYLISSTVEDPYSKAVLVSALQKLDGITLGNLNLVPGEARIYIAKAWAKLAAPTDHQEYLDKTTREMQFIRVTSADWFFSLAQATVLPTVAEKKQELGIGGEQEVKDSISAIQKLKGVDPTTLDNWFQWTYLLPSPLNKRFNDEISRLEAYASYVYGRILYEQGSGNKDQAIFECQKARDLWKKLGDIDNSSKAWGLSLKLQLRCKEMSFSRFASEFQTLWKYIEENGITRVSRRDFYTLFFEYLISLSLDKMSTAKRKIVEYSSMLTKEQIRAYDGEDAAMLCYGILTLAGLDYSEEFERLSLGCALKSDDWVFSPAFKFANEQIDLAQAIKECENRQDVRFRQASAEIVTAVEMGYLGVELKARLQQDQWTAYSAIIEKDPLRFVQMVCLSSAGTAGILANIISATMSKNTLAVRLTANYGKTTTKDEFLLPVFEKLAAMPLSSLDWENEEFRDLLLQGFYLAA